MLLNRITFIVHLPPPPLLRNFEAGGVKATSPRPDIGEGEELEGEGRAAALDYISKA